MMRLNGELQQALDRGATVLTPGERAAHAVRSAYGRHEGRIGSLHSWMHSRWSSLTLSGEATRLLLNGSQEMALWRRAIRSDSSAAGLHPENSLAELAAAAWSTLHLHNGRGRLAAHAASTDSRAFLRWVEAMERLLEEQEACTAAELPVLLAAALDAQPQGRRSSGGGSEILLLDFDGLLPAQKRLCEALEGAGHSVRQLTTAHVSDRVGLFAATDAADEVQCAARWLRQELESSPDSRLALVVPQLGTRRAAVERALLRALAPGQAGVGQTAADLPFEFSLGQPLLATSQVATALLLLRLAAGPISLAQGSSLLLSPLFGAVEDAAERMAVAEFDATELRRLQQLRPELTLDSLRRQLAGSKSHVRLHSLLDRTERLRAAAESEGFRDGRLRKPHARWADSFRRVLAAAGWTDALLRQAEGFALHRRWEAALHELSMLDFDGSRPSLAEALEALRRIAGETVYAPESNAARVQVLGPLELGGVGFDALWFLSASDMNWPEAPALNPLLPRSLARRLGMAGADAPADAEHGRRVTLRIAGTAERVVFSYPVAEGKQNLLPSGALAGLQLDPYRDTPEPATEPEPMEEVADQGTRHALPDRVVRGGARLLELQSACAFRAFAEFRLFASDTPAPGYGLDAGERGSLVHTVMQLFWQDLKEQSQLKSMSSQARRERLNHCITEALRKQRKPAQTAWDRAYLEVQGERLRSLLEPWLDLEASRPEFSVLQRETRLPDVQVGPLRLTLQADRVDKTPLGDVILDYKTGEVSPREWRGERPDRPQLPLYALAHGPVAGVAFATLRPGKGLKLEGFAASADVFGGKPGAMDAPDLESQVERWRRVLERLAGEFHAGTATVNPKEFPATCTYCSHRILCRVDPTALQGSAGNEEDSDG